MKRYSTYKPSGIEWMGDIPEHWVIKKIKYLSMLRSGESITSEEIQQIGAFPVFGGNGLRGYCEKFTHEGDYVLIGRQGALCGNINYASGTFWASEHAIVCTINSHTHYRWFGEILRTMNLNRYSQAAAQPGLAVELIENLYVATPPLPEQTAIAAYLDAKTDKIDRFIAHKQKLIELLKEERTAIINQAVTKGLNPNAPMKPSGIDWLGDIPAHWEVKKLKYVVSKVGSGITPNGGASVYTPTGITFLRSQNIYNDGLYLDDVVYISEAIHDSMKSSRVENGDVLLNITGASIGRCFYATADLGEANVNQHVCILRPLNNILTKYLHLLLISQVGQEQIEILQTGANREGLNFEQLRNFILPLPDIELQLEIVTEIIIQTNNIDTAISKIESEITLMQEYRTALVNEVVTGKVKVI